MKLGEYNLEEIKQVFDPKTRKAIKSDVMKESAVLIIINPDPHGSFSLILTERNKKLSKHAGEMSFPGGRVEPDKDKNKIDTALRETEEEIGIRREEIEVVGMMNDIPTLTGYIITPVIGIARNSLHFTKNDSEVVCVYDIPISFFLSKDYFMDRAINVDGHEFPIYNFNYRDNFGMKHTIWGATAHLIVEFMKRLYKYNPSKITATRPPIEKIEKLILNKRKKVAKRVKEKNLK